MIDRCVVRGLSAGLILGLLVACSGGNEKQFYAGRDLVAQRSYAQAIDRLQAYLDAGMEQQNASRAVFFIAKARLGQGDLSEARRVFEQVIQLFPRSLEAHKARYKIALIEFTQGDELAALARFSDLVSRPGGTLVPEAELMVTYLTSKVAD